MIQKAQTDIIAQATVDDAGAADLIKRYPRTVARDFDTNPSAITEADALIAYLQMLGTLVDFKTYDRKANVR
jgi:cytochrome c oxidase cbb3-type subunit 2